MAEFVIVSDPACDLNLDLVNRFEIDVAPMRFSMDGQEFHHYIDEREMSIEEFYQRIEAGSMPITSQVTPFEFEEVMRKHLEAGKDILAMPFSSGLSGTYQSACLAAQNLREEFPKRKILVSDNHCASVGLAALLYYAGMMREEGKSIEEVASWVEEHRHNIRHWFAVDDLFHLKRGGRVSSVEAILGTALKIKPILTIDTEGKLVVKEKARGSKKAMSLIIDRLKEEGTGWDTQNQTVVIGHAHNPSAAEELKNRLLEEGLVKDVIICKIGPIIGTHVGPGMFACVFLGEEKS